MLDGRRGLEQVMFEEALGAAGGSSLSLEELKKARRDAEFRYFSSRSQEKEEATRSANGVWLWSRQTLTCLSVCPCCAACPTRSGRRGVHSTLPPRWVACPIVQTCCMCACVGTGAA